MTHDEDQFGGTDPVLLLEEIRSYLPIEVTGEEAEIESLIWEKISDLSEGIFHEKNLFVSTSQVGKLGNEIKVLITHLDRPRPKRDWDKGTILSVIQSHIPLVELNYAGSWSMWYDDFEFTGCYRVIEYDGGGEVLVQQLHPPFKRLVMPAHALERAQEYGTRVLGGGDD